MFSIPTISPCPEYSPESVRTCEGEWIFSALFTADAAALAMLAAVAMTDPLMAFIPLIRPDMAFTPALYRLIDANVEYIPLDVLLAIPRDWLHPLLIADTICAIPDLTTETVVDIPLLTTLCVWDIVVCTVVLIVVELVITAVCICTLPFFTVATINVIVVVVIVLIPVIFTVTVVLIRRNAAVAPTPIPENPDLIVACIAVIPV